MKSSSSHRILKSISLIIPIFFKSGNAFFPAMILLSWKAPTQEIFNLSKVKVLHSKIFSSSDNTPDYMPDYICPKMQAHGGQKAVLPKIAGGEEGKHPVKQNHRRQEREWEPVYTFHPKKDKKRRKMPESKGKRGKNRYAPKRSVTC